MRPNVVKPRASPNAISDVKSTWAVMSWLSDVPVGVVRQRVAVVAAQGAAGAERRVQVSGRVAVVYGEGKTSLEHAAKILNPSLYAKVHLTTEPLREV